ncbi:hypothetical protein ACFX2I_028226 [Malus domestica]
MMEVRKGGGNQIDYRESRDRTEGEMETERLRERRRRRDRGRDGDGETEGETPSSQRQPSFLCASPCCLETEEREGEFRRVVEMQRWHRGGRIWVCLGVGAIGEME